MKPFLLAIAALACTIPLRAELNLEAIFGGAAGEQPKTIAVPDPENRSGMDAPAAAAALPDRLEFLNGDLLSGKLVSLAPEGLVWHHADVEGDLRFLPVNLKAIELRTPPPVQLPPNLVQVGLTNGDSLRGQVVEMDADKLILNTVYAGRLTIRSPMLANLRPAETVGEVCYTGPNSLDEWVRGNNQEGWEYKNGALYSIQGNGSLGRDVKLPDRVRIDFELAWQGQAFFTLSLFTDKLDSYYGPGYQLAMQGNHVSLNRRTRGSSNGLGGHHVPLLGGTRKAEISVRADRKAKTVALLMDGALIQQWTDPAGLDEGGTGIVLFVNQNRHRLRNLRVLPWDGKIEQAGDEEKAVASAEDQIQFANGDRVTGEVLAIRDGEATVKSPYAELKIPLERIVLLTFREANRERARRNAGDVQGLFRDGGQITLNLVGLRDGLLEGESENFGQADIRIGAFSRLRVNIYDERQDQGKDKDEEW